VRQAIDAGVDHYLVKPADPSALLDLLATREEGRDYDGMAAT
jgi:YesN/AraC family two-component response regulator